MKKVIFIICFLCCGLNSSLFAQRHLNGFGFTKNPKKVEILRHNVDGEFIAAVIEDNIEVWYNGSASMKYSIPTAHKEISDIAFTPDGKYLFSTGKDKSIKIWNFLDGRLFKEIKGHTSEIVAIAVSSNGNYLASASLDQTIKLWDLKTYNEVNTFFQHRCEIYDVAISNDGKYLATAGEDQRIVVREIPIGYEVGEYRFSEKPLVLKFHEKDNKLVVGGDKGAITLYDISNPTMLPILWNTNHPEAITDIAFSFDDQYMVTTHEESRCMIWDTKKKIILIDEELSGDVLTADFNPNGKTLAVTGDKNNIFDVTFLNIAPKLILGSDDKEAPMIVLSEPQFKGDRFTTDVSRIQLKGIATDRGTGLYSVLINGREAIKGSSEFAVSMDLTFGDNPVEIRAMDAANNVSIKSFHIIRESSNVQNDIFEFDVEGENHLLIIAADQYQFWPQLTNAVSDAKKIENVLKEKYGFKEENIYTLLNEQVTRDGMVQILTELLQKVKPADNLVIYYSGHGDFNTSLKEGYWVPIDGKKGERHHYLSNSELKTFLKAINSKHTFLIADACFSGSLFASSSRGSYYDNLSHLKSRWGLTAGSLEEVSDGKKGETSPFCRALLEFLSNPPEKEFTVGDIVHFVKKKVANETSQQPQGNILADCGDEGGQMVFKVNGF
ncbi:MAG: hypothetical protein OHK0038_06050 [Flammeovirgaceae bacterium]